MNAVNAPKLMNDTEVDALVQGFESGSLLPSEFSHHAHMAVALSYVSRMPEEVALGRMRAGVQKFAAAHLGGARR